MSRRGGIATTVIAICVVAAPAQGASTRAEYVAQLDPVCQAGQQDMRAEAKRQNPSIKKLSAKLQQQADMLTREQEDDLLGRIAAKEFSPTLKVFPRVTTQIAAVAPAPGDQTAVTGWLNARGAYIGLIRKAVRAAKRGKSPTYNRLIENATGKLIEGEIPVEGFGFRFCLLSSPQD